MEPILATDKINGLKGLAELKVQLELQTERGRRPLKTLDVKTIPRVGEFLEIDDGTFKVEAIIHTPVIRDYEAIVVLRKR